MEVQNTCDFLDIALAPTWSLRRRHVCRRCRQTLRLTNTLWSMLNLIEASTGLTIALVRAGHVQESGVQHLRGLRVIKERGFV
jgi:hypothetical protein